MVLANERQEVAGWRQFRFLGYMTYLSNTGDKTKKTIEKFLPLPGDIEEDRGKRLTQDEILNSLKLYGIN